MLQTDKAFFKAISEFVLCRRVTSQYCLSVCLSLQTDKAGFKAAKGGCNRLLAGLPLGAGWLLESLLTFLLVFVVFTATDQARAQNTAHLPILAPAGIGFAVFVCHLAAVALDGCSINRKLHLPALTHLWLVSIYLHLLTCLFTSGSL